MLILKHINFKKRQRPLDQSDEYEIDYEYDFRI